MSSPFENGANASVFYGMLDLRFKEWARLRKNRKARARYREMNYDKRRTKALNNYEPYP